MKTPTSRLTNIVPLVMLLTAFLLAPLGANAEEIDESLYFPWKDPNNPNVILMDPDGSQDGWNVRRDTSKREPGLMDLQRYEVGVMHLGGFPTFLGAPMALTTEDLKAGGVEVAMVGLNIDDNFIPGGRYAANKLRTLIDYMGFGVASYDPTMHLEYTQSLTLADYGNIASHYGHTERSLEEVHKVMTEILDADAIPMSIGGTHIQMWPMITALAEKYGKENFAVLHVDAHYDAMSIGMGRYVHNGRMIWQAVERGLIKGSDIVQIGLRSTSPGTADLKWMMDNNLKFHYQSEINAKGFETVLKRALAELKGKKLYISFDMDGIDPAYAPGVGTQEPEGLTSSEAMQLLRAATIQNEIVAIEINEYNPFMDDRHETTGILMDRLMRAALAGLAAKKKGITDPFYVAPTGLDHTPVKQ